MLAIITLLIELVLLSLNKSMGAVYIDDMVASIFISVFSITFLVSIQSNQILRKYDMQLISGYFVRIILLFFDIFGTGIYQLPQSGDDSAMFFRTSKELVLYGKTNRTNSFNALMSRVFKTIGISKLYGQFLLMLLSIITIILVIHTLERVVAEKEKKEFIAWLICMLPNYALLSSLFLRESLVTFFVTLSACCMIKWMLEGNGTSVLLALLASMVACIFHSGCIGITIGCIVCVMIFDTRNKRIHVTISGFVLSMIVAISISYVFLQYGDLLMSHFTNIKTVGDIANTSQLGGSSYAQYVGNSNTPINMVIFTIPRIIYFLFSPFPWQWRGIADIIAFFFSGLFYLVVITNAINSIKKSGYTNQGLLVGVIVIAFFCTFIFAWGVSNTGTASRHRDKMVCIYAIIMALSDGLSKEVMRQDKYIR